MSSIHEKTKLIKKWQIIKYASNEDVAKANSYEIVEWEENLLLNEGITVALQLMGGIAATAFSNANAYLGVGDSATAEAAVQTGLQAATNLVYAPMVATYPQVSGQTITWKASFGSAAANFAWNEFTVANGNSNAAANLNRKVSAQGTKTSGQTWVLSLDITLA